MEKTYLVTNMRKTGVDLYYRGKPVTLAPVGEKGSSTDLDLTEVEVEKFRACMCAVQLPEAVKEEVSVKEEVKKPVKEEVKDEPKEEKAEEVKEDKPFGKGFLKGKKSSK